MTYETFIKIILKKVQRQVGAEQRVILHHVLKNNNTMLDGLTILKKDKSPSPTIYLQDSFRDFQRGATLEQIVEKIIEINQNHDSAFSFDIEEFKDYDRIKKKIAVKLVNYEENRELLKNVPYKKFLDLAVICYVLVKRTETATANILVKEEHRKIWGIEKEALFLQAMSNSPHLLPMELKNMYTLIDEMMVGNKREDKEAEQIEDEPPMYVLSNTSRLNGAVVMLYDGVVKKIAKQMGTDLYILPSSIHEVILVPKLPDIKKEWLEQMVKEVNEEEVEPMERLSNQVYFYSREKDGFSMTVE